MQHDWITDVLMDLRAFAQANGLDRLARQLEDTLAVATAEIDHARAAPLPGPDREARRAGSLTGKGS